MAEVFIAGVTGGREHALGEALYEDGNNNITFSHGNPGTEKIGRNLGFKTADQIVSFSDKEETDLVFIGPEALIIDGLADRLRAKGVAVFAPGADGGQLEGSKIYAEELMTEAGILHPSTFNTASLADAMTVIRRMNPENYVIKADGQAGGKGVILPENQLEAEKTVQEMMSGELFGEAGKKIQIQGRIKKIRELSAILMLDGKKQQLLGIAQDHKRLLDNDLGPNTGGMGAYSPVPFADAAAIEQIMEIGERTLYVMRRRSIDYRGTLYLGLAQDLDNGNAMNLLEYNVRFGDPETQPLVARLRALGGSLFNIAISAAHGFMEIDDTLNMMQDDNISALTVCAAAENYPKKPILGDAIVGLDHELEGVSIHQAGTESKFGKVVTAGGRVLYLTGVGSNLFDAGVNTYAHLEHAIYFKGMQYRRDIGLQARMDAYKKLVTS